MLNDIGELEMTEPVASSQPSNATGAPQGCSPGSIKPLDWQELSSDRGDGSRETTGWEADSGFGAWYIIEIGTGGFKVAFDGLAIGETIHPERAKSAAQEDFEKRVAGCLHPAQGAADCGEPVLWICLVGEPRRIRAWTADRTRMESLRAEGLDMQPLFTASAYTAPETDTAALEEIIADLRREKLDLREALQFIADGYDNQDVNHVDYRVKVYQVATEALALPSTQNSPPVELASQNSAERMPSSDAASAGGETVASTPRGSEA